MGHDKMRPNGTAVRFVAVVLLIALPMGPLPAAGRPEPLEDPGWTDGQPRFHVTTPPTDVMPLGIGVPKRLAMVGSWVIPATDEPQDFYPTRPFWSNDDPLMVVYAFYKPKADTELRESVLIKHSSGLTVFRFEIPKHRSGPAGLVQYSVMVGNLPAGFYKVTVKIQEGDKTVGQQYWFVVFP